MSRRRSHLDPLESRTLLATSVAIVSRNLLITGDAANNVVRLTQSSSVSTSLTVTVQGQASLTFKLSAFDRITAQLNAGADQFYVTGPLGKPISVDGGPGADLLQGGIGRDTQLGGDGDDLLFASDGADILDGQLGTDSVLYSSRTTPVSIVLDGLANDGAAGEQDNVSRNNEVIFTGTGSDRIDATAAPSRVTLSGGDGSDTLLGGSAIDQLIGGPGADSLYGGGNTDILDGGEGSDSLDCLGDTVTYAGRTINLNLNMAGAYPRSFAIAAGETDVMTQAPYGITGGNGNDWITSVGTGGFMIVNGGPGNDSLFGGNSAQVYGDDGDDLLSVTGRGMIYGDNGNDTLRGSIEGVFYNGDAGTDTLDYSARTSGVSVDLGRRYDSTNTRLDSFNVYTATNAGDIEVIRGTRFNDAFTGTAMSETFWGGDGNDTITGNAGDDTVYGEAGADSLLGGPGADTLFGANPSFGDTYDALSSDVLFGGPDADSLVGGNGNDSITGDDGNDTLSGGNGNDSIYGLDGDDFIDGDRQFTTGTTADSLYGGNGNDTINGNAGNDFIDGGAGRDRISGDLPSSVESAFGGHDTVFGGAGDDTLRGEAGNDLVSGDDGDDFLITGNGNDFAAGGPGSDSLVAIFGSGTQATNVDTLQGNAGIDNFWVQGTATPILSIGENLNRFSSMLSFAEPYGGAYSYTDRSALPLFEAGGPQMSDVDQGLLGNCWFLGSLGALVGKAPNQIRNRVTDLGNGRYLVKMKDGVHLLSAAFPTQANGTLAYAETLSHGRSSLWTPLMEKAAVFARTNGNYASATYAGLANGFSGEGFALLGYANQDKRTFGEFWVQGGFQWITDRLAEGKTLTMSTFAWTSGILVGSHVYTIVGAVRNAVTGRAEITLYNPWGNDGGTPASGDPNDGLVVVGEDAVTDQAGELVAILP
jgi:Ca2+-binding RTX toxin-like protein